MSVTPLGPLSIAIDALKTLIAGVSFFQTWSNTNSTTALGHIFEGEMGFPITSISLAANVATVVTREPHNITNGTVITLDGPSIGAESTINFGGQQTITSVPDSKSFTFTFSSPESGTFFPDGAFVLPTTRPWVCICEPDDAGNDKIDIIGTNGTPNYSGELEILVEGDVTDTYYNDPYNALVEAKNNLGQLAQGIATTSGTLDFMVLNTVNITQPVKFIARLEQADNTNRFERWQALIRVTWGLTG